MFRRPLISALAAGSSRRAVRPAPAQRMWQRTFASEPAPEAENEVEKPAAGPRKKVIFDKASSPELDHVFAEMLHKIILPARLPKDKLKLISQAKNAQQVEVNPVVIEVEGYEHRFPILDFKEKDIPKSRTLLYDALHLMKTRDDWANLARITSGYLSADRRLRPSHVQAIIRWAGKTGNIYAIIDALRNHKESKLRIRTMPNADNILNYLQMQALESGYAEKETRDARNWAVQLQELMENPAHRKKPAEGRRPMHLEPQVIGQILHLAAAHAVRHQGGRDEDGLVAKLATMLADRWPEGRNLYTMHGETEPTVARERMALFHNGDAHLVVSTSRRISIASFIHHGIGLAKQVVEPELAAKLEPIEQLLAAELAELKEKHAEKNAHGWLVHDMLEKA